MGKVKTYQSVGRQRISYALSIVVKNDKREIVEEHNINFEGGRLTPREVNGTFMTADPFVQKLIENHESYGKKFVLIAETDQKTDKTILLEPDINIPDMEESMRDNIEIVGGINTGQKAKKYLLDNYKDVTALEVSNNTKILECAKKHHVRFPDLEQRINQEDEAKGNNKTGDDQNGGNFPI